MTTPYDYPREHRAPITRHRRVAERRGAEHQPDHIKNGQQPDDGKPMTLQ